MNLHQAIRFTINTYMGKKQSNGEPAINHLIRVMQELQEYGLPDAVLAASLLHDVYEDHLLSIQEIKHLFGYDVSMMVYFLSKNESTVQSLFTIKNKHRYLKKIHFSHNHYPYVFLIKMSEHIDVLLRIQTLDETPSEETQDQIRDYFLPLYEKYSQCTPSRLQSAYNQLLKKLKQALNVECENICVS